LSFGLVVLVGVAGPTRALAVRGGRFPHGIDPHALPGGGGGEGGGVRRLVAEVLDKYADIADVRCDSLCPDGHLECVADIG